MTVSNIALKSASMRCYDLHIARPKTMSTNWGSKISRAMGLELKSPKALIPIVCYVCKAKRGTVYATCENQECAQSKIRNAHYSSNPFSEKRGVFFVMKRMPGGRGKKVQKL